MSCGRYCFIVMLFEKVERGCQKNKFVKYVDIKQERGSPSLNLCNSPL